MAEVILALLDMPPWALLLAFGLAVLFDVMWIGAVWAFMAWRKRRVSRG